MKILVATKEKQRKRKNDFFFCNEGEVVRFSSECDGEPVDGACGCRRSMSGCTSHKGTTTMKVIDSPMTVEQFTEIVRRSYKTGGWYDLMGKDAEKNVKNETAVLISIALPFDVGMVVERRGSVLQERR